ncbi:MAG: hypothetical protein A2V65_01270 [Deltaproteobacteria bacterium RBG_13_49_15]|nr:MAG: hypothetical protein A2V65_01270 [Deltaproteobacteria bacterium RBG_13_49_15]
MSAFKIEFDQNQLKDVERAIAGAGGSPPKVVSRAVNKTMTGIRTDATTEIGAILNLKKSRIRDDFKIKKMSMQTMTGNISSTGKPVGLINFGAKKVSKGVSVQVKKTKPRSTLYHAFITTAKGAENVFSRAYRGARATVRPGFAYGRLPRLYRFPIERLTGPRIQDIYDDPAVMGAVLKKADTRLKTNLSHEMDYELSKLK